MYYKMRILGFFSLPLILALGLLFNGFALAPTKTISEPVENKNDTMTIGHYNEVVDSYLRGLNEKDLEGILVLYADNATVEDPVGSKVIKGKEALRQFYTGAVGIDLRLTRTGPVRIAGMEVAFPFELRMMVNRKPMKTDIIDVFRFDEAGKILSMRAFWGPSNQQPAKE